MPSVAVTQQCTIPAAWKGLSFSIFAGWGQINYAFGTRTPANFPMWTDIIQQPEMARHL